VGILKDVMIPAIQPNLVTEGCLADKPFGELKTSLSLVDDDRERLPVGVVLLQLQRRVIVALEHGAHDHSGCAFVSRAPAGSVAIVSVIFTVSRLTVTTRASRSITVSL